MSVKDLLLALCVVLAWGVNFVVIKLGLHGMPPFLLAGLRFTLVVFPAIFFVKRPNIPLRWLVVYGMTISFGQFAFLFLAIKLGMPAGLASLVVQAQAFFTLLLGALLLAALEPYRRHCRRHPRHVDARHRRDGRANHRRYYADYHDADAGRSIVVGVRQYHQQDYPA